MKAYNITNALWLMHSHAATGLTCGYKRMRKAELRTNIGYFTWKIDNKCTPFLAQLKNIMPHFSQNHKNHHKKQKIKKHKKQNHTTTGNIEIWTWMNGNVWMNG